MRHLIRLLARFGVSAVVGVMLSAFLFALFVIYFFVLGPRMQQWHRQSINQQMRLLTERAKATPPDLEALNSIIASLHSEDHWERTAAAIALAKVGNNAEPATDALAEALRGDDRYVALEAAKSLGEIGPGARRAVPALIDAVHKDPNAGIGWFAAESLGRIAEPNDVEVIAVLEKEMKSPYELMRYSAAAGLKSLESRRGNGP